MAKRYDVSKGCTFCYTCVFECPFEAITLTEKGAQIDQEKCKRCGKCYENCASQAIEEINE